MANALGVAMVGAVVSLLAGGLVSMIVLYTNVATLTSNEIRFESSYEKRDSSIQKQLGEKAGKADLQELREEIRQQLVDLKDTIHTVQQGFDHDRTR